MWKYGKYCLNRNGFDNISILSLEKMKYMRYNKIDHRYMFYGKTQARVISNVFEKVTRLDKAC